MTRYRPIPGQSPNEHRAREESGSPTWRRGGTDENVGSVAYGREGYDSRSPGFPDENAPRTFAGRGWSEHGGDGAPTRGKESYGFDYRRTPYGSGEGDGPSARPDVKNPDEPPRFRPPKGYKRSDARIREDVCDRLGHLERVDPSDVEVSVKDGQVTLSGTVGTRWEKHVVENQAAAVSGVVDVDNGIRVRRYDAGREDSPYVGASRSSAENVNGTKLTS